MDVGGSFGAFLSMILGKCTRSRGIILDLPHSKDGATQLLQANKLSDRVEFYGGSFFEPVPTADILVAKFIFHDWNDSKSLEILAQCREALLKSTFPLKKLIVVDVVLGETSTTFEAWMDLLMMILLAGKERTRNDWDNLLKQGGFKVEAVTSPGTLCSIIEARIA